MCPQTRTLKKNKNRQNGIFRKRYLELHGRIINLHGPLVAAYVAFLVYEYKEAKERGEIEYGDSFAVRYEKICQYFNTTTYHMRKWRKMAEEAGLIFSERRPSINLQYRYRFYTINWNRLKEYDKKKILYIERPME